ncbi:MAG: class I SAM-dependent methyltransferase [Kiloniellales bacterium]
MNNVSEQAAITTFSAQYRDGDYLEKVPEWHAGDAPWKAGKVLTILQRNAIEPRTLCDVGCGAGDVLANLQKGLGPDVQLTGYDISPQAIRLCAAKANERLTFKQGNFLEDSGETFDLVLLLDVFEHVQDYLGFLTRLRSRAHWFVFHIPLDLNVQALLQRSRPMLEMRQHYGHLHYFTAETALATLADCGYVVKDSFFTWDAEIDGLYKPQPGLKGWMRYPLTCAIYGVEWLTLRYRPQLMARLRKRYNLMVLAAAG